MQKYDGNTFDYVTVILKHSSLPWHGTLAFTTLAAAQNTIINRN